MFKIINASVENKNNTLKSIKYIDTSQPNASNSAPINDEQ